MIYSEEASQKAGAISLAPAGRVPRSNEIRPAYLSPHIKASESDGVARTDRQFDPCESPSDSWSFFIQG